MHAGYTIRALNGNAQREADRRRRERDARREAERKRRAETALTERAALRVFCADCKAHCETYRFENAIFCAVCNSTV